MKLTKFTKGILDFMFYAGILTCVTLPFTLKWVGNYIPHYKTDYYPLLSLFLASGIFAVLIIKELRRMFATVLREDCFVKGNVKSLEKMGNYSFCIALFTVFRLGIIFTMASLVVIAVFVIAGLFSKVLSGVFEEAVTYKLENDLTI